MPRTVLAALLLALAVGLPAVAAASAPRDKEQVRLTPADQAAARAAILRRGDLGSGWAGGTVKPNLSSSLNCPGYEPKQSDLVLTGAAEAHFRHTGLQLRSVAQVLRTRSMVARDWKRTVVDPRAIGCLRHMLVKGMRPSERLVSFRKVPFPRLARYAAAYRARIAATVQGRQALVLVDVVLLGRGRTELTLSVAAPAAAGAAVSRLDARLARLLLSRARA